MLVEKLNQDLSVIPFYGFFFNKLLKNYNTLNDFRIQNKILMTILTKLFLNSKLDLIRISKFVKQLFRIQIKKDRKVSLWNQVKSRMEACYSELALTEYSTVVTRVWRLLWRLGGCGAQPVELRSKSSQWGQILYEVACKFFQYFPYQYHSLFKEVLQNEGCTPHWSLKIWN